MSEQELQKLLALKRCEIPDEDKLSRVESNFRYALRLEKIRALTKPAARYTILQTLLRWSPALACAVLLAATAYQLNTSAPGSDGAQSASIRNATNNARALANESEFLRPADPWAGAQPTRPRTSQFLRNAAFDATPVAFEESRITF